MSCGVGHRCSSDLVLLWLWCSPAAIALIGPLAWEPPYAKGATLKDRRKKAHFIEGRVKEVGATKQREKTEGPLSLPIQSAGLSTNTLLPYRALCICAFPPKHLPCLSSLSLFVHLFVSLMASPLLEHKFHEA